jgi:hypothetical protein
MASGLLDTSVVIHWDNPAVAAALPDEAAVCAITLAELAAGPHLASTGHEGARRQARLQQVEATFEPLPFEVAAARSYGQVVAAVANGLALYTRNPDDFAGLGTLIEVIGI